MRRISLQQANQRFSKLIASVEKGDGFVITRRGRPIAWLLPYQGDKSADPQWSAAYDRMVARLEEGASLGGVKVRRDELYDRPTDTESD